MSSAVQKNFSSGNQFEVVEELICFPYSLNDKHLYRPFLFLYGHDHNTCTSVDRQIGHLHDDVMRALHSGSCSQRKTKWRLIAGAGSLAVFQSVLATVKQT